MPREWTRQANLIARILILVCRQKADSWTVWRPSLVAAAASAATVVGLPRAHAQERVRIAYEAPADCPSADDFEARVRARTTRFTRADAGGGREFRVRIAGAAPSRGRLVVASTSGEAAR